MISLMIQGGVFFSLDLLGWDQIGDSAHKCVIPVSPVQVDVVAVLNSRLQELPEDRQSIHYDNLTLAFLFCE